MTKETFIALCNRKVKLVRLELGYSQQTMCQLLGLSKKTLIEIEKWRASLGFQGAVALCVLFQHTREITLTFGPDIDTLLQALCGKGFMRPPFSSPYALWIKIMEKDGCVIEQNNASQLYRLQENGVTVDAAFDLAYLRQKGAF